MAVISPLEEEQREALDVLPAAAQPLPDAQEQGTTSPMSATALSAEPEEPQESFAPAAVVPFPSAFSARTVDVSGIDIVQEPDLLNKWLQTATTEELQAYLEVSHRPEEEEKVEVHVAGPAAAFPSKEQDVSCQPVQEEVEVLVAGPGAASPPKEPDVPCPNFFLPTDDPCLDDSCNDKLSAMDAVCPRPDAKGFEAEVAPCLSEDIASPNCVNSVGTLAPVVREHSEA